MNQENPDYVSKQPRKVSIFISGARINGIVHIMYNHRVSDLLNGEIQFIPITDVEVYSAQTNNLLLKTDFISLNKSQVIYIQEQ